jgi:Transglutaminase-like superfamily
MTDRRTGRIGWATHERYRTASETQIRDFILLSGWAFEFQAGESGLEEKAAEALDRFVALGLPFRQSQKGRRFDPVETLNFIKWMGLAGKDFFWVDRFVETGRRLVRAQASAGRYSVALRRTVNIEPLNGQGAVRLRLPIPLVSPSLSNLTIVGASAGPLATRIGADRIEARGPRPAGREATLEARFSFSVSSEAVDRDRGGLERCLAPNEGLIQVTPRISALADACAAGVATPAETVRRFWDFILDNLCLGAVHYDAVASAPSAGEWALNSGWFDCRVGSALLASLCRARGVPARLLSGYLLYPAAPTFHFWVEVWLGPEGWTPFDLMGSDLSVGGRGTAWRDHFAGRVDARMTTTCMPLRFTGSPGVRYPPLWRVVSSGIPGGAATSVESVDTSALVLRDEVRIKSIA